MSGNGYFPLQSGLVTKCQPCKLVDFFFELYKMFEKDKFIRCKMSPKMVVCRHSVQLAEMAARLKTVPRLVTSTEIGTWGQ